MRRPSVSVLVVVVGLLLLADLLIVNDSLAAVASIAIDVLILIAAGAALAGAASLAWRRGTDLWRRRGDPVGAVLVLAGMVAVLVAGLRPGGAGADDPAVAWIVVALMIPIASTLFGLLFVSTLAAAHRSVVSRRRGALTLAVTAAIAIVLLLPLGTLVPGLPAGPVLAEPVAAVLRGLLMGIAIVTSVFAARTMIGIGPQDD